jgi:hypothetical protein
MTALIGRRWRCSSGGPGAVLRAGLASYRPSGAGAVLLAGLLSYRRLAWRSASRHTSRPSCRNPRSVARRVAGSSVAQDLSAPQFAPEFNLPREVWRDSGGCGPAAGAGAVLPAGLARPPALALSFRRAWRRMAAWPGVLLRATLRVRLAANLRSVARRIPGSSVAQHLSAPQFAPEFNPAREVWRDSVGMAPPPPQWSATGAGPPATRRRPRPAGHPPPAGGQIQRADDPGCRATPSVTRPASHLSASRRRSTSSPPLPSCSCTSTSWSLCPPRTSGEPGYPLSPLWNTVSGAAALSPWRPKARSHPGPTTHPGDAASTRTDRPAPVRRGRLGRAEQPAALAVTPLTGWPHVAASARSEVP